MFNGSKPTNTDQSLNDILHTGLKLQLNIFDVLLGVRKHKLLFITDFAEMFRQILVDERDQLLQQIFWFNEHGEITPHQLTMDKYRTQPLPYLSVCTLLQLIENGRHRFPLAVTPSTHGRYVNEIFGEANNAHSLQQVVDQLEELCKAGDFPLAKWASNHFSTRLTTLSGSKL